MSLSLDQALKNAILRILRPLVRILLRNGVSFRVFADLVRWVYVDVGFREFGIKGRKQTTSRVSVITGLTRKEVQRLRDRIVPDDDNAHDRYNRATRVISGWMRDTRYCDNEGNSLDLPLEGEISFTRLVKRFSGDMPVRAILDELIHIGAVERKQDGTIKLLTRAYLPHTDEQAKLDIMGTDVADLINTVNHNLSQEKQDRYFQRKVSYDNVPADFLAQFKQLSAAEAQTLLEGMNQWLALRDRDANPSVKGSGRMRVGLGIYYFEENLDDSPNVGQPD